MITWMPEEVKNIDSRPPRQSYFQTFFFVKATVHLRDGRKKQPSEGFITERDTLLPLADVIKANA